MASRSIHALLIILIGFSFIIGILTWTMYSTNDNLSANTLEDTVKAATYQSRDNSSRISRGVYIINKDRFSEIIRKTKIKEFDGKQLSSSEYKIYYLVDKSAEEKLSTSNKDTLRRMNSIPIKAVRVVASVDGNDATNKKKDSSHIITQIIQTNGHSNNKENDLTAD